MAISVKCRACGAAFAVKDELGGKKIRCVRCKEVIAVASNTNIVGVASPPSVKPTPRQATTTTASNPAQPGQGRSRVGDTGNIAANTTGLPSKPEQSSQPEPVLTVRRARRVTAEELNEPIVKIAIDEDAQPTVKARVVRGPQDLQAESVRHTAATLSAPPEDFETLRQKVFASFTSPAIEPVPVAWSYRIGIAVTSLFMIMLPLAYLAMIFSVGWLVFYHAVNHTGMMSAASQATSGRNSGRAVVFAFLAYLTPMIAGVVLILFMLKPLFSKQSNDSGRRTLKPNEDPLLFEFVNRICAAVGSPRPRRIDIDCNINASASFGRGLLSMVGNDLVLTIGMPLVAGLTMRQFAGVLAHEFGHFSQGAGMRVSYMIRSISMWFTRVVYERDAWDEQLAEWSHSIDIRIGWVLYLTRLCVWLTRRVLWVLMLIGHLVSGYLLRQMEFDADRHETRLAGSRTFATTSRQLAVLNIAHRGAISDLGSFYSEGRLGDNLPKMILLNADQLPEKVHAKIDEMILESRTGVFDTHPADSERMTSASQENTEGIFQLRLPAAHLFKRFDFLSRAVTWDFYKEVFGDELKKSDIHPVDELMERLKIQQAAWKAVRRFFQDHMSWYRPLPTPAIAWEPAADVSSTVQNLKRHRARMLNLEEGYGKAWKIYDESDTRLIEISLAEALLLAGVRVRSKDFSMSLTTRSEVHDAKEDQEIKQGRVEAKLAPFEQAAADRLYAGLSLARTKSLAAPLAKDGFSVAEIDQLLEMFQHVNERLGQLLMIRDSQITMGKLLSILSDNNDNEKLIAHIRQSMQTLFEHITDLRSSFDDLPYPFDHARADISVADYLLKEIPDRENPVALYGAANAIGNALPPLQARVLGRLCQIAECVETHFGLPLLEDPPEPEIDLNDEDDEDEE